MPKSHFADEFKIDAVRQIWEDSGQVYDYRK